MSKPDWLSRTTEERFWSKVDKTESCWIWTAAKNRKGYGQFRLKRVLWIAHRYSYVIHKGEIPAGQLVMHSCDTPACVNPNHLNVGTYKDNNNDRDNKGRFHTLRGSTNGNSKLREDEVLKIRSLYETGKYSYRKIGSDFGVDQSLIMLIVRNKIWKHV